MTVLDAQFAPEQRVNTQTLGFYFHLGKKLLDVLILSDQQRIRVPIHKGAQDRLVLVAKSLGEDEERHGSVSFILDQYFGVNQQMDVRVGTVYRQWVTLFDHPDDDVYDGIIGEDDDELPRVCLELLVEEAAAPPKQQVAV